MKRDLHHNSSAEPLGADVMNDLRLTAARKRLAECSGQTDAIEAVREIVSNFLGSEEMALFDFRSSEGRTLWSFGTVAEHSSVLDSLSKKGLGRMAHGECQIEHCDSPLPTKKVRAFVPIRLKDETVGVLAILQLLPQKSRFDAADMDLLNLLSQEAGKALFDSAQKQISPGSESKQ
jgi:hypothetical protein